MDEHHKDIYQRYHRDIWLPDQIKTAARDGFLPPPYTELRLSDHYLGLDRRLPDRVWMPEVVEIIDVTVVKETQVIYRVLVRGKWSDRMDFCMVLDGDFSVVTGFFINRRDHHPKLDTSVYEEEERNG